MISGRKSCFYTTEIINGISNYERPFLNISSQSENLQLWLISKIESTNQLEFFAYCYIFLEPIVLSDQKQQ